MSSWQLAGFELLFAGLCVLLIGMVAGAFTAGYSGDIRDERDAAKTRVLELEKLLAQSQDHLLVVRRKAYANPGQPTDNPLACCDMHGQDCDGGCCTACPAGPGTTREFPRWAGNE